MRQPRSQGLSSSHKREWSSTTPSCGKTKDPGNEVGNEVVWKEDHVQEQCRNRINQRLRRAIPEHDKILERQLKLILSN